MHVLCSDICVLFSDHVSVCVMFVYEFVLMLFCCCLYTLTSTIVNPFIHRPYIHTSRMRLFTTHPSTVHLYIDMPASTSTMRHPLSIHAFMHAFTHPHNQNHNHHQRSHSLSLSYTRARPLTLSFTPHLLTHSLTPVRARSLTRALT